MHVLVAIIGVVGPHFAPVALFAFAAIVVKVLLIAPVFVQLFGNGNSPKMAVEHSFARANCSPRLAFKSALSFAPRNWGSATEDRIPTTITTIISSTNVKPFSSALRAFLRLSMAS